MKILYRTVTAVALLLILALGVLFAVQNDTPVGLDLLLVSFSEQPVALWILLAFALGACLGMLTSAAVVWRLRTALLRANRENRKSREKPAAENS